MDKNEQICDYNEGWNAGYKTGHKDGELAYLDILDAIGEIKKNINQN